MDPWPLVLLGLASRLGLPGATLSDDFDYASAAYWDRRYAKQAGGTFEWYGLNWPILNATLGPHLHKEHRILHLGTGNSPLPEEMHLDGYRRQVASDVSATVVAQMRSKLGHLAPSLEFVVEDALRTSFDHASFDAVLEKGTMEAVGSDRDCALMDEGCEMLVHEKTLALEALRLLRPGGVFVSVADEFKPFPELWARGLDRVERARLSESDGIPVPKHVFLCFKAGRPEAAAGAPQQEL